MSAIEHVLKPFSFLPPCPSPPNLFLFSRLHSSRPKSSSADALLSWQDHIYLGLDLDRERGNVRLEPDVGVSQWASEVQKPFRCGSHTGRKEKNVSTT